MVAALLHTGTDRSKFLTFCTNINKWLNLWDFGKAHETRPLPEKGWENRQTSAWRKHPHPHPDNHPPNWHHVSEVKIDCSIQDRTLALQQWWSVHLVRLCQLPNQPSYWPPHNLHTFTSSVDKNFSSHTLPVSSFFQFLWIPWWSCKKTNSPPKHIPCSCQTLRGASSVADSSRWLRNSFSSFCSSGCSSLKQAPKS